MSGRYSDLPVVEISVDPSQAISRLATWRHSFGQGGINTLPLPDSVVEATRQLEPRLVRIFLQEFFFIRDGRGGFDWSRMDRYVDSISRTGAKIVAALTIKPRELYPEIDASIWRPTDWVCWQEIVVAVAQRYSVERKAVTHWEIGNEPDIGENGGSPYLIPDPVDYAEYYTRTVGPILATCPKAKVGGTANAGAGQEPLPGFLRIAAERNLPLHFVSWHRYSSDPALSADDIRAVQSMTSRLPHPPELMVTEFSPGFSRVSVPEQAIEPWRAAAVAGTIWEMIEADLDWSFHYHLWEQACYPEDFEPFFRDVAIMTRHWNEVPHRFALFDLDGNVRPTWFVFWMLHRMAAQRCAVGTEADGLRVLASREAGRVTAMLVNYGPGAVDRVGAVRVRPLERGRRVLTVYRIDDAHSWDGETPEMRPVERREVAVLDGFEFHVALPADTVAMAELCDAGSSG